MSSQVCDKLSERPWQKYDTSSVPKIPGIYAIGEKKVGSKKIEYMYVGRSEDMKRRLQQHKGPTPQQDIDQRVARKFKQQKESELRIKYVSEKQQKTKEGAYIDCLTKKTGHRPVMNKRSGDGCASCAVGHKQSTRNKVQKTGSKMKSPSKTSTIRPVTSRSKVGTSGPTARSSSGSKVRSSFRVSSARSSSGSRVGSSGGTKVRSGVRASPRSFGVRRGR